jgi:hypothetical protein
MMKESTHHEDLATLNMCAATTKLQNTSSKN